MNTARRIAGGVVGVAVRAVDAASEMTTCAPEARRCRTGCLQWARSAAWVHPRPMAVNVLWRITRLSPTPRLLAMKPFDPAP
jgi:hypothetical protein